jgi:hypothetical protein
LLAVIPVCPDIDLEIRQGIIPGYEIDSQAEKALAQAKALFVQDNPRALIIDAVPYDEIVKMAEKAG